MAGANLAYQARNPYVTATIIGNLIVLEGAIALTFGADASRSPKAPHSVIP
jgi:hypothetical protein